MDSDSDSAAGADSFEVDSRPASEEAGQIFDSSLFQIINSYLQFKNMNILVLVYCIKTKNILRTLLKKCFRPERFALVIFLDRHLIFSS